MSAGIYASGECDNQEDLSMDSHQNGVNSSQPYPLSHPPLLSSYEPYHHPQPPPNYESSTPLQPARAPYHFPPPLQFPHAPYHHHHPSTPPNYQPYPVPQSVNAPYHHPQEPSPLPNYQTSSYYYDHQYQLQPPPPPPQYYYQYPPPSSHQYQFPPPPHLPLQPHYQYYNQYQPMQGNYQYSQPQYYQYSQNYYYQQQSNFTWNMNMNHTCTSNSSSQYNNHQSDDQCDHLQSSAAPVTVTSSSDSSQANISSKIHPTARQTDDFDDDDNDNMHVKTEKDPQIRKKDLILTNDEKEKSLPSLSSALRQAICISEWNSSDHSFQSDSDGVISMVKMEHLNTSTVVEHQEEKDMTPTVSTDLKCYANLMPLSLPLPAVEPTILPAITTDYSRQQKVDSFDMAILSDNQEENCETAIDTANSTTNTTTIPNETTTSVDKEIYVNDSVQSSLIGKNKNVISISTLKRSLPRIRSNSDNKNNQNNSKRRRSLFPSSIEDAAVPAVIDSVVSEDDELCVSEIVTKLRIDERKLIAKMIFASNPWPLKMDRNVGNVLKLSTKTLRKVIKNDYPNLNDRKLQNEAKSSPDYSRIERFLISKLHAWKSTSAQSSADCNTYTIDRTLLTRSQLSGLLMYICRQVPNFDPAWAHEIARVTGLSHPYILEYKKTYQNLQNSGNLKIPSLPSKAKVILDKLVESMKQTPSPTIQLRPRKLTPFFVSKVFGRLMFHFKRMQKYKILNKVFKANLPLEKNGIYKEIGDYLGFDETKIRRRHFIFLYEKINNSTKKREKTVNKREEQIIDHMIRSIESVIKNSDEKEEESLDEHDDDYTKGKRRPLKINALQKLETKIGLMKNKDTANIFKEVPLTFDEKEPSKFFQSISFSDKCYFVRYLYKKQPWPAQLDKNLRMLLIITSFKFNLIMRPLRNSDYIVKHVEFTSKSLAKFQLVEAFLLSKLDEWQTAKDSTLSYQESPQLSKTSSVSSSSSPSPSTAAAATTTTTRNDNVVVKQDPDKTVLDQRNIIKYVFYHIPSFHSSWCRYFSKLLSTHLPNTYKYRLELIRNQEIFKSNFDPEVLTEQEIRIGNDLVSKIENKDSVYKGPTYDELNEFGEPFFNFGTLDTELSYSARTNILYLVLQKASPFDLRWTKPITRYLDLLNVQVTNLRKSAMKKKIDYKKVIKNPTEKEKEIATHMADIINNWRDAEGKPYDVRIEKRLDKFKSLAQKYYSEHNNVQPPDQKIFEWSTELDIPDELCYRVLSYTRRR